MKIEQQNLPFLRGDQFTDGLLFPLGGVARVKASSDRLAFLREMVRGKRVLHVGCVDHIPLIEEKRRAKVWLHEVLVESAAFCAGLDINREGIECLKKLGFGDVYQVDIVHDEIPAELRTQRFDMVILGEMIEHVDNPVEFLAAVRKKFSGVAAELVTTTPNVFRVQNLVHTLRRREFINSDHRYWFSPFTLAKVLTQAGYTDVEIDMVWDIPLRGTLSASLKRLIGSIFPATRDCLIARSHLH